MCEESWKHWAKVSNEEISKGNDAPVVKIDANVCVENLKEWLTKRKTEAETHEREEKIQLEVKLLETRMTCLLK